MLPEGTRILSQEGYVGTMKSGSDRVGYDSVTIDPLFKDDGADGAGRLAMHNGIAVRLPRELSVGLSVGRRVLIQITVLSDFVG